MTSYIVFQELLVNKIASQREREITTVDDRIQHSAPCRERFSNDHAMNGRNFA